MPRYKAIVEYCGTPYVGMQKQFGEKTIQASLEAAISRFFQSNIEIDYAGRTDAGVHASGQVINFDCTKERQTWQIKRGLNANLRSEQISICDVTMVQNDFHSRFHAKKRWYVYKIMAREAPLTFQTNTHLHVRRKLNIEAMIAASQMLLGKHDFSSFRDKMCQAQNPVRTLETIEIYENNEEVILRFGAKSFLHHMVRNIVGTLIEIGLEKKTVPWIVEVLEAKDRRCAGINVKPHGLYFLKADY